MLCYILFAMYYQFNIRTLTNDELAFAGLSERGFNNIEYIVWSSYVISMGRISSVALPILNIFIFFYISVLISIRINNFWFFYLLLSSPTVFYYVNSYLRDSVFFLSSLFILYGVLKGRLLSAWGLILFLRFEFFIIYLISVLISTLSNLRNILSIGFIFIFVFVFLLLTSLLVLSNDFSSEYIALVEKYKPRETDGFGLLGVNKEIEGVVLNFNLSWLYFWFGPSLDHGKLFGPLTFFESITIFILFSVIVMKFGRKFRNNKRILLPLWMILFSFLFASFVPSLGGHIRFRVFFFPFLVFLATYPYIYNCYTRIR